MVAGQVFVDESTTSSACGKDAVVAFEAAPFGEVVGEIEGSR